MPVSELVTDPSQVMINIETFSDETSNPALRDMLAYVRHWYAVESPGKGWLFAPSKFIGYVDMSAKKYVKEFDHLDGRVTEKILDQWFIELDRNDELTHKIELKIRAFLARHGKSVNALARIHVSRTSGGLRKVSGKLKAGLLSRITFDADVLAGKPCIRNMRIRVSDILEMLGQGASRQEILEDFPYLEDDDISAALAFALAAVDHRIVRAA